MVSLEGNTLFSLVPSTPDSSLVAFGLLLDFTLLSFFLFPLFLFYLRKETLLPFGCSCTKVFRLKVN